MLAPGLLMTFLHNTQLSVPTMKKAKRRGLQYLAYIQNDWADWKTKWTAFIQRFSNKWPLKSPYIIA